MSGLYSAPPALEIGNQTLKGKTVPLHGSTGTFFLKLLFLSLVIVDVFLLSLTLVQMSCIPHRTSLEATLERSLQGRLDSVLVGWTRHGQLEQVAVQSVV